MKFDRIASGCLVAFLAVLPAQKVAADAGDALLGALVGGVIGGAIVNENNKKRYRTTSTAPRKATGISSAQREANREVQTSLNYFGYPVGAPDGAIGPKSRSAISQYQASLGYPPTGQLTEYERTVLVSAYHRAIAGGPMVSQTMATHPMGTRGLLMVQRDEMAGITPRTGMMAMAPAPQMPVLPVAPAATLPLLAAVPEALAAPEVPAAPGPAALPSFMGAGVTQVSLASQCNKISLLTNTNGGYTTSATMTDANFALSEQFCLARTYAMAQGEELSASVPGFTPAQIAEQCKAFGPALKDNVAALSMQPREEVLRGVSTFVLQSGMAPAQLAGTARICLGVGYTTDAMDVAIGSALLLTALGEKGYAELLGHHLSQGFGTNPRSDLAAGWYGMGLEGAANGLSVFAPGLPDRNEVIRKASMTLNGRVDAAPPAPVPAALPGFAVPAAPSVVAAPVTSAPATLAEAAPPSVTVPAVSPAPGMTAGTAVAMAARLPLLLFGN
ncbi:peptidoglycan-binding protein [Paracoccaceae bacterium Fryx2]|nr:peptidoglycan-binding protein [Paracoccaceae bacterium Fryx2]